MSSATPFQQLLRQSDVGCQILSYLDGDSIRTLAGVNRFFAGHVGTVLQQLTGRPLNLDLSRISTIAPSPTSSSPATSGGSYDSFGSSDTDMTELDPDPEWQFEMTEEVEARLASLPQFRTAASLPGLPNELQIQIFGYMDTIDSVCLGLSNARSYGLYRALFGTKVPLTTRREDQNPPFNRSWEVVGMLSCEHCGIFRCELFEHIKSWFPDDMEYCKMTQKFGNAEAGTTGSCFRGKPSKPNRCGRHPVRTTTKHQDDSMVLDTGR